MNPTLLAAAQRLAPMMSRFMSRGATFATPFWKTSQIDTPSPNVQPTAPGNTPGVAPPISGDNTNTPTNYSEGASPQDRINSAFSMFGTPMPQPRPQQAPQVAPEASQTAGVPLPQPRPPEAPMAAQAPEMGFFQRNAAMMTDPGTGQFIDPMAAAQAQAVKGPELINKMMALLNNKATA